MSLDTDLMLNISQHLYGLVLEVFLNDMRYTNQRFTYLLTDICGGSPDRGHQTTLGLFTTAIFSVFAGCIFGNFRDKAMTLGYEIYEI